MFYKVLCVLCASCLPFLFSLNGDFVFDDSEAIVNNPDVSSGSWTDAFKHDYWGTDIKNNLSHKSYRPFTILTFRANYFLNDGKFSAKQYKLVNLILHITCCFILEKTFDVIVNDLYKNRCKSHWYDNTSLLATLLFAVHPIHSEAVSGIVGRSDLLAGNTFFLSFLFYRKATISYKWSYFYLFCSLIMGGVSMLFKENGVTVLGFCLCFDFLMKFSMKETKCKKKNLQECLDLNFLIRLICTSLAILALLYVRWRVMGGTKPTFQATDNPAAFSDSLFTKIFTYQYLYFLNVVILVWPQWLCYDWSMGCVPLIRNVEDYRLIFILLMYWYGIRIIKSIWSAENNASTKRLMVVALLLGVIPFLPAANIFYPVGFVIAERVLYIPSAGFCLLVTLGFQKFIKCEKYKKYKSKMTVLFFMLLLMHGLRSWERAEQWRSEYQLFINGYTVCPMNAKVHYNIAKAFDTTNRQRAVTHYLQAISLHPRYYQAMNNLGNLLKSEKLYELAEEYFKAAVKEKEDFPAGWMNYGIVLAAMNRFEESEEAYKKALLYRKKYPDCLYNLGNLYLQMNDTERAMESWLNAINLNSSYLLAWTNLLTMLNDTGDLYKALKFIPEALKALPKAPTLHFVIGNIYGKLDKYTEAEKHFKKAIELFGSNVKAIHYGNLGILYHRWKKFPLALVMYQRALQIDPKYTVSRKHIAELRKKL